MNVRHKNTAWLLPPSDDKGNVSDSTVTNAVLMDIRDELQRLNAPLHCHNTVAIPELLRAIKRNTTKRKRKATP